MESIRKPKRINIRGSDEREHPFLVKGGEDLRQDQRIEQLFDVMNIILSQDAAWKQALLVSLPFSAVDELAAQDNVVCCFPVLAYEVI